MTPQASVTTGTDASGSKKRRRRMLRQTKWKVKQYQRGNCINCGQPRGDSPYKRRCKACAAVDRERRERRDGCKPWVKGKPGRPPKNRGERGG